MMSPPKIVGAASQLFLWLALASLAAAEGWRCEIDFESQCTESGCTAFGHKDDGNMKPVFAEFDDSGSFRICMYSGCYQGKGTVLTSEPFLSIVKEEARWTGTSSPSADVFIVLDLQTNIGMFKASSFVQPIRCKLLGHQQS